MISFWDRWKSEVVAGLLLMFIGAIGTQSLQLYGRMHDFDIHQQVQDDKIETLKEQAKILKDYVDLIRAEQLVNSQARVQVLEQLKTNGERLGRIEDMLQDHKDHNNFRNLDKR